jgi:hypothetical protein
MMILRHEFVEFIPDEIEDGVLYITYIYCTAVHKCVCGCGNKVVTPISPDGWKLLFDGKTVSLSPSIGSWRLACQSHYWVENNKVVHARKWTLKEIENGKEDEPIKLAGKKRKRKKKFWLF